VKGKLMKKDNSEPTPIILGGDLNAYSMARGFYEEFGVSSHVFAREKLGVVSNTKYINLHINKRLTDCDFAVPELLKFALSHEGATPIIVACADWYMEMLQYARDALDGHFYFLIPSFETWRCVSDKASLYSLFSKYGIPYPKTEAVSSVGEVPAAWSRLDGEVVIKPSDSALYWKNPFEGMRKVYFVKELGDALSITEKIFGSGYCGKVILQKRIYSEDGEKPPRSSVLTTYSNRHGRVIRACLGDVLLEERGKTSYGNYLAIISRPPDSISRAIIDMLNGIGYTGAANFDILTGEGGRYCLELNPRQGRSFDYLRGCGISIPRLLYADRNGWDVTSSFAYKERLWSAVPLSAAFRYATDDELRKKGMELASKGKYTLAYKNDNGSNIARKIYITAHNLKQNINIKRNIKEAEIAFK
jgi:D-aspartate ligase